MSSLPLRDRWRHGATAFLQLLPALLLGLFAVRTAELLGGFPASLPFANRAGVSLAAYGLDLVALWRGLPLLALVALPAFLLPERIRRWGLGVLGATIVTAAAILVQYYAIARVPLGADLFAYTAADVRTTLATSTPVHVGAWLAVILPVLVFVAAYAVAVRSARPWPAHLATVLLASGAVGAIVLPAPVRAGLASGDLDTLAVNKAEFFVTDALRALAHRDAAAPAERLGPEPVLNSETPVDPELPFLHAERTRDTLSPFFAPASGTPPNLVFIVVEGLGRSFSGPGATLGSFTPFLDSLIPESLYWENFLANQGRTFGVLPSLLGSLPFGPTGFNELPELPAHDSLPSILKARGYRTLFFAGFDPDFDSERRFLKATGVERITGIGDFDGDYSITRGESSWGYPDGELLRLFADRWPGAETGPFMAVVQTVSMHPPFTVPDENVGATRFARQLDALELGPEARSDRAQFEAAYRAILYTDDALRQFFARAQALPGYANTIFVITGDHRMPEIPMGETLDRYHVPLLIHSRLLQRPARLKGISSHFDVAPSLLAMLSHRDGLTTPPEVSWLGCGLDTSLAFHGGCEIPLKQTKAGLADFVSGTRFLHGGTLFELADGLGVSPSSDAAARDRIAQRFARFQAVNAWFGTARRLARVSPPEAWIAYDESRRRAVEAPQGPAGVAVFETRVPARAAPDKLAIEVAFGNGGGARSGTFVPLVIVMTPEGRELTETYGPAMTVEAGAVSAVHLDVKTKGLAPGRYLLAVLPSDPETGRPVGAGRYHLEFELQP